MGSQSELTAVLIHFSLARSQTVKESWPGPFFGPLEFSSRTRARKKPFFCEAKTRARGGEKRPRQRPRRENFVSLSQLSRVGPSSAFVLCSASMDLAHQNQSLSLSERVNRNQLLARTMLALLPTIHLLCGKVFRIIDNMALFLVVKAYFLLCSAI